MITENIDKVKKKTLRNILILVFLMITVIIIFLNQKTEFMSEMIEEKGTEEKKVENKTNLKALKSSKYTGKKFEDLKIGDTKDDVDKKLGKGDYLGKTESGYEVYSYKETKTSTYQLYFENDKLKEVGVILNN